MYRVGNERMTPHYIDNIGSSHPHSLLSTSELSLSTSSCRLQERRGESQHATDYRGFAVSRPGRRTGGATGASGKVAAEGRIETGKVCGEPAKAEDGGHGFPTRNPTGEEIGLILYSQYRHTHLSRETRGE